MIIPIGKKIDGYFDFYSCGKGFNKLIPDYFPFNILLVRFYEDGWVDQKCHS